MPVIELRNYRLVEGRTPDFIRYFEEHFSSRSGTRACTRSGSSPSSKPPTASSGCGPSTTCRRGCAGFTGFYASPFWLARRETANAMMLEHHGVHLLRPLGPISALTREMSLEDRASEPAGALPRHTGLVAVAAGRSW